MTERGCECFPPCVKGYISGKEKTFVSHIGTLTNGSQLFMTTSQHKTEGRKLSNNQSRNALEEAKNNSGKIKVSAIVLWWWHRTASWKEYTMSMSNLIEIRDRSRYVDQWSWCCAVNIHNIWISGRCFWISLP